MKGFKATIVGICDGLGELPENVGEHSWIDEANQEGLSLIEILVAIAILFVGLILLSNFLELIR